MISDGKEVIDGLFSLELGDKGREVKVFQGEVHKLVDLAAPLVLEELKSL
eukprot:CAMPEP_0170567392 /NCGR_PEP_ID=MMETSP0211-20121228/80448_1 /TAXON_ID=311385 /ORGANISM="Pseudokeronopsis sp., Strain OXSARD2" /LENGTH=49 /DNA_ID= /DNA_START= /DNA_END= /DNA_ORIENTATION=